MDNKFVFIVPFYNTVDYIAECADSILSQSHSNWIAVFADDHSDDGTSLQIPDDKRFTKLCNDQRANSLANIYLAIDHIKDKLNEDDILVILDGDDKLLNNGALTLINEIYNKSNALVTYGQYVTSDGTVGRHCRPYSQWEFNDLRKTDWRASPLRTFKYKVYKEFLKQDPTVESYKDTQGNFYTITGDIALMFPLMEIAGFENVQFNPTPVYYYRLHENNDHVISRKRQLTAEKEIRKQSPFTQVFKKEGAPKGGVSNPNSRLSIIVPYREREAHLDTFLSHIPAFLENESDIEYQIIIVEQKNDNPFNRASLLNIGAHLAFDESDYFCFHDIDLLPIEDTNYRFVENPTHLSALVEQFNWKLPYNNIFGGVVLINKMDFVLVNGYSNMYNGWGCEDDDFYHRVIITGLVSDRRMGKFKSLPHPTESREHPNYNSNYKQLLKMQRRKQDIQADGFNQLQKTFAYKVHEKKRLSKEPLAEFYSVDF